MSTLTRLLGRELATFSGFSLFLSMSTRKGISVILVRDEAVASFHVNHAYFQERFVPNSEFLCRLQKLNTLHDDELLHPKIGSCKNHVQWLPELQLLSRSSIVADLLLNEHDLLQEGCLIFPLSCLLSNHVPETAKHLDTSSETSLFWILLYKKSLTLFHNFCLFRGVDIHEVFCAKDIQVEEKIGNLCHNIVSNLTNDISPSVFPERLKNVKQISERFQHCIKTNLDYSKNEMSDKDNDEHEENREFKSDLLTFPRCDSKLFCDCTVGKESYFSEREILRSATTGKCFCDDEKDCKLQPNFSEDCGNFSVEKSASKVVLFCKDEHYNIPESAVYKQNPYTLPSFRLRDKVIVLGNFYAMFVLCFIQIIQLFVPVKSSRKYRMIVRAGSLPKADTTQHYLKIFDDECQEVHKTSSPPSRHSGLSVSQLNDRNTTVACDGPEGHSETQQIQRESYRLSSFQRFPASVSIDARKFASAGFYHTGQYDEVKCFACSSTLRNLSSRTDPFLLSMHKPTCRFARGQDDCGNVPLDRFGGRSSVAAGPAQTRSAGETLFGAAPRRQASRAASTPQTSFASAPGLQHVSNSSLAPVRHYQGLDMRNFQTARPVAPPPPSTYDVPIHRQLATIQNPDQARLIRSLNLYRESHRFQTFTADWSSDSAPSAEDMAASGWFYLGNLDRTQCFCCGGVLRNWRRLDNPNTEHITHFPHCTMAQGRESRNIPDMDRRQSSAALVARSELTEQQRRDLRIMFPCEHPVTPSMRSMRDRVQTFNNWHFTRATPHMLAEAGFFSLGVRDRVKCFYCNGGLQNWRQDDEPWHEHAKWYPTCEFLLQQKGPEFIHNIVARFPNINRPRLTAPGRDVPPPVPRVQSGPEQLPPPPSQRPVARQTSPQHSVNTLEEAMQSEVANTVVGMGFEESLVREVMRRNIERHGVAYQSTAGLLDAVIEVQSEQEAEEVRTSEPAAMDVNSPPASFSFEENRIGDEENLELYESGVDMEIPGGSSVYPSSVSFGGSIGQREAATSTPRPSQTPQQSNIMDAPVSSSLTVAPPINPERVTSLPPSHLEDGTYHRSSDTEPRSHSTPESTEDRQQLAQKLKKQLQELRDERLCKVCLDRTADVVFIPCGHICCCLECTRALRTCPICRQKIEKAVRTYTS